MWRQLNGRKHYLTYSNVQRAMECYKALNHRRKNNEDIDEVFMAKTVKVELT